MEFQGIMDCPRSCGPPRLPGHGIHGPGKAPFSFLGYLLTYEGTYLLWSLAEHHTAIPMVSSAPASHLPNSPDELLVCLRVSWDSISLPNRPLDPAC